MVVNEQLTQAGVPVLYVQGPSGDSPEDRPVRYILGYVGEKERLLTAERTQRGKVAAALRGKMPVGTGRGLYGYRYDKDARKRTIWEPEAVVVRRIFDWVCKGMSAYAIASRLNDEQVPTKTGSYWHPLTVRRLVQNQAYTGVDYYGKEKTKKTKGGHIERSMRPREDWMRVEGFTPALIDDLTFDLAQDLLKGPKARPGRATEPYLLSGHLTCAKCGTGLTGSRMRPRGGTRDYRYYRCRGTGPTSTRPKICTERYVKEDELDDVVWEHVRQVLGHPEVVLEQPQRLQSGEPDDFSEEVKRLEGAIRDCEHRQRQLVYLYSHEAIDDQYIDEQAKAIKVRQGELEQELADLLQRQDHHVDAQRLTSQLQEFCE